MHFLDSSRSGLASIHLPRPLLRILYDHQIFDAQRLGGISRYFVELVRGNSEAILAVRETGNVHLLDSGLLASKPSVEIGAAKYLPGYRRFARAWETRILRKPQGNLAGALESLREGAFEVFHPTYYDPYFLEALGNRPFVLTVHDMIHEKFPELFPGRDPVMGWKRKLAAQAARVIAVSENTKRDLIDIYGMDPARISVVYHGSNLLRGGEPLELPERYLLFTGVRSGYKNFLFMIQALAALLRDDSSLCMVCTGSEFSEVEILLFQELGIEKKMIHVFASEAQLFDLYRRALLFIFPSYYEGFGIPILEAFEAGCPALLARASCFPEIAGDAGLYFDPKGAGSLFDAARSLVEDAGLRAELTRKGSRRLGDFSWKRCVSETLKCYESVI